VTASDLKELAERAGVDHDFGLRGLGEVPLKGIASPVVVYEATLRWTSASR